MTDTPINIGARTIGRDSPPLVVAEMSGNHNQSLDRALAIVDAVADAGAGAIKLQTYTPATMTLPIDEGDFVIEDPGSPWAGQSLHDLYALASTPWEWHRPLFERARERGLLAFSTPFDETAVDFLDGLDVPCFKIASFENGDPPLIRRVAATGKPLFLSTGMATLAELDEALRTARDAGCRELVLLKCTSAYPSEPDEANLLTLPQLRDLFDCQVGLSDHTLGLGVPIASVALGATVIEKHVTLRRADGGVDSAFSLEPDELAQLVRETDRAWRALGRVHFGPTPSEERSMRFRRSLYIVRDLEAGDELTPESVRAIRPGYGLAVKYLPQVIGRRVNRNVRRGTRLTWDLLT